MTVVRFDWHIDQAIAPDGTVYAIFSEHVRGEPRFYWPEYKRPDEREWHGIGEATRSRARRSAGGPSRALAR